MNDVKFGLLRRSTNQEDPDKWAEEQRLSADMRRDVRTLNAIQSTSVTPDALFAERDTAPIADLIADLMHLCDTFGFDKEDVFDRGRRYYEEEVG